MINVIWHESHLKEMSFMELGFRKTAKKRMDLKPGGLDIFTVLQDLTKVCTIFECKDSTTVFMLMKLPQFDHIWSTFLPPKICHKDARHLIYLSSSHQVKQLQKKNISIFQQIFFHGEKPKKLLEPSNLKCKHPFQQTCKMFQDFASVEFECFVSCVFFWEGICQRYM